MKIFIIILQCYLELKLKFYLLEDPHIVNLMDVVLKNLFSCSPYYYLFNLKDLKNPF